MKNINEEVNYMKYLLGYQKGVVISEQQAQQETKISANIEIPKMGLNSVKLFNEIWVSEGNILKPVIFLKYDETSAIVIGNQNGTPVSLVVTTPQGNETNRIIPSNASKPVPAAGLNEYQLVQLINKYDNGSIPKDTISTFIQLVNQNFGGKFGTLTPDRIGAAVSNDPNKTEKYKQAITSSGVNPNFKPA